MVFVVIAQSGRNTRAFCDIYFRARECWSIIPTGLRFVRPPGNRGAAPQTSRPRNEFGIRLALGAQARDVLSLVLGCGLRLALLGAALGLIGAWGVARLLPAIAPGLPPADLVTTGSVTLLVLGIAVFACWLPARRATNFTEVETRTNRESNGPLSGFPWFSSSKN
jgi:hypothetical protein